MTIGLVGKKAGMTRVFTEDGASVPVTVIEVEPNRIAGVKTVESDGYRAVQVTTGSRKAKHLSKAIAGQYARHYRGDGFFHRSRTELHAGHRHGIRLNRLGQCDCSAPNQHQTHRL